MSKIGVDVSSYQGSVDWAKAAQADVKFAILKIIRKDLQPDKQFENNWTGCTAAGVPIQGVYNYSYATTVQKAKTDAHRVLEVLNGRRTMVWLDVEDKCQEGIGNKLIDIINAYAGVIKGSGYEFGVYTGQSFYNTYIKPYGGVDYPLWIARYGTNSGKLETKYEPEITRMLGWQYTSRGSVNGISGNVDMNVWYGEVTQVTEPNDPALVTKTVDEFANEVLNGIWGNGADRKKNVTAAGYDYNIIQARVNEILNAEKKVYYTVRKGDTLSGIAKHHDTTVSALVQLNGIENPNRIYERQKIRVK